MTETADPHPLRWGALAAAQPGGLAALAGAALSPHDLGAALDALEAAQPAEALRAALAELPYPARAAALAALRGGVEQLGLDALERGAAGARAALQRALAAIADVAGAAHAAEVERLQQFEMLADNAVDGVIISGLDGRVRYVNPTMAKLVGFTTPADMIAQQSSFDADDPARREFLENILPVLLERGFLRWDAEPIAIDGKPWYTENLGFLLRDPSGQPVATAGFVRDVTAQRVAQLERDQLREEMIAVQQSRLRELSTPLIPISDTIVVMPLVGSIDSARAQQLIEALLSGVVERQADTAIIDITGVPLVDTQVADALLRAARAVGLVGARVILTGVRPEVAQTLVSLGADLGTLIAERSLQAAIARELSGR